MASGDAVQQIKDRLSIIDVVSSYVELHQAGKSFKGKSPFTNEKTPSFHVSAERGMYYCFSSSQGGDMFTFIEKMEGVDFKGALKILAEKAGVELVPEDPEKRSERDTLYSIMDEAAKFAAGELGRHEDADKYLKDRGVKSETISKWRIGYVPGPPKNGWRHMREHLKGLGYSDDLLAKAGLVKLAGEGKEPYDVFRDRIMFPLFDASGRVVAFSGRVLSKDTEAPKYVNSPETALFSKSEVLYGYDKAKEGIRKYDFSLIVEGQFDVVMSHQAGYNNAVAVSGTALTPHHVGLLQRLSNRVVLALDADRAGIAAVKRAADIMLSRGIDLKVAELPEGSDPADLVQESADKLKKVIGGSMHVIEFLLHVLRKETKDERSFKLKARDEIVPYLLKIESHIDREHFMGVVAEALNTTTDAISLEVARLSDKRDISQTNKPVDKKVETTNININTNRTETLKNYLAILPDLVNEKEAIVIKEKFSEIAGEDLSKYREEMPAEIAGALTFIVEQAFVDLPDLARQEDIADRLQTFHELKVKKQMREVREELKIAESNHDEEGINKCSTNITNLQKELFSSSYGLDIFK